MIHYAARKQGQALAISYDPIFVPAEFKPDPRGDFGLSCADPIGRGAFDAALRNAAGAGDELALRAVHLDQRHLRDRACRCGYLYAASGS